MPSNKRRKVRIKNLLAESIFCYWCGRPIFKYELKEGERTPDDYATIEHINSLNQGRPRPLNGRWVLACYKDNQERAAAEQNETVEEWYKKKEGERIDKPMDEMLVKLQERFNTYDLSSQATKEL